MNIVRQRWLAANFLFSFTALGLFFSGRAEAFSLIPMNVTFEPSGPGASKSFEINNPSDKPIAVEISMATREIDINGKETQNKPPEIDKNFVLFPIQTVLKAHEKRTVRVSWVGDPKIKAEMPFRLIAEQLPVETEKPKIKVGGAINVVMRYLASIYVTPPDVKPDIIVKEAGPAPEEKGKENRIKIVLENRGTAHLILAHAELKLTPASGETVVLVTKDIPEIAGQNMLPGLVRQFFIPWPKNLPAGPFKATLETH